MIIVIWKILIIWKKEQNKNMKFNETNVKFTFMLRSKMCTKINSKWIKFLNVKAKIIKL